MTDRCEAVVAKNSPNPKTTAGAAGVITQLSRFFFHAGIFCAHHTPWSIDLRLLFSIRPHHCPGGRSQLVDGQQLQPVDELTTSKVKA